MSDGYFAPHSVTELLQKKGVLEPIHAPVITSQPVGMPSVDSDWYLLWLVWLPLYIDFLTAIVFTTVSNSTEWWSYDVNEGDGRRVNEGTNGSK